MALHRTIEHFDGPVDMDEVLAWVEKYGHPEGWAKAAQAAHGKAEKLAEENQRLRDALRECRIQGHMAGGQPQYEIDDVVAAALGETE